MGNKRKLPSRRPCFLKVFEGKFTKQLAIPPTFTENFDGDIPNWFILEIAGARKCWRVDIEEDQIGGLCLSYGWAEFVEEHCLEVGNFLLFTYEDPLILHVKIFEKDGTERSVLPDLELECEVEASECQRKTLKTHHYEEAAAAESLSMRPCRVHKKLQEFSDRNITEIAYQCEVDLLKQKEVFDRIERETGDRSEVYEKQQEDTDRLEVETADQFELHEKQQDVIDWIRRGSDDECRVTEMRPEHTKRIEKGVGKVCATENGVTYTLTWRRTPHLYYYLTIPRAMIAGKTFSGKETVILEDQEGNNWPVKLRVRPGGRVDLTQGWKEFLIDNDVRDGNVLILEFLSDRVIQIHIERAFGVDHPSQSAKPLSKQPVESSHRTYDYEELAPNCINNHNTYETTEKTETVFPEFTNSSFSTTWKLQTRGSYLHIPKAIAKEQKLENKDTVVLCDPEGRRWQMKIRTRASDGRVGLAQGWSSFWRHYKIADGDTLVFEFVSDHLMRVNIIRGLQVQNPPTMQPAMKQEATHPT